MNKPVLLVTFLVSCGRGGSLGPPLYKYGDVMHTAASNIPLRGYHILEGGYYPAEMGGIGGFGGAGLVQGGGGGGGGAGGGQYLVGQIAPIGLIGGAGGLMNGMGYGGGGIGQGGIGLIHGGGIIGGFGGGGGGLGIIPQTIGGEAIEKGQFSEGKKKHNDEQFLKKEGKKGEETNHGEAGFTKGQTAVKDVKGDSGYYKSVDGEKKIFEDGKEYHGGQHFNKEGKNEEQKHIKQGHKKGHKIKSFKTSHHKDETGKTEEYYDEDHDEGGNYAFKGEAGNFAEKGAAEFKGNNEEGQYKQGEAKKEGHFKNEHLLDKANANEGKYGGKKYAGEELAFGNKNGAEDQSLLGHQEATKFYKHQPFVVPFHH